MNFKTDPRDAAWMAVNEMIEEGLKKHEAEGWRQEDRRMHALKALRHLATYLLILDSHVPPDGENHLKNAICRTAMALTRE